MSWKNRRRNKHTTDPKERVGDICDRRNRDSMYYFARYKIDYNDISKEFNHAEQVEEDEDTSV